MDISISNPREEIKYIKFEELIPGEIFLFKDEVMSSSNPNHREVHMREAGENASVSLSNGVRYNTASSTKVYKITKYKFEYEAP